MAVFVDRGGCAGAGAGVEDSGDRAVVDREGQGAGEGQDVGQEGVDHAAVSEGYDGVLGRCCGDEVFDGGQYSRGEGGAVDLVGEVARFDAGVGLGEFGFRVFDGDVGGQVAVVLGQVVDDLDGEVAGGRGGERGVAGAALRAADYANDVVGGERGGTRSAWSLPMSVRPGSAAAVSPTTRSGWA